ncbi:MAG: hypothetical protein ACR2IF_15220 [Terriglobales bacterium]
MNWNRTARWAVSLLLVCLASGVLWAQSDQPPASGAQSDQPSLGDIARQKAKSKAKKVVTNDEIPPSALANAPAPAPTGATASPAGGPANTSVGPAAGKPGDAKTDPKEQEKQSKLDNLQKERDSLDKVIAQLQKQIDETNEENRKATFREVIEHAKQEQARAQADIDKLKAGGAGQQAPPAAPPK